MDLQRKHLIALTWLAGLLSFAVSYLGLMAFAFTSWGNTPAEIIPTVLVGATLLLSFPAFLLFLRWRGLAVLLQWSAVIICIASLDAQEWGRHSGIIAKLCAAFSLENAVFFYPSVPAVFLTILYWLRPPREATQQKMSVRH